MSFLSSFSNTRPVPRVFKSSGIPSVFQVLLKIYHGPSKVLANFLMTFRCKSSSRCCLPSSAVTDGNFSVPSTTLHVVDTTSSLSSNTEENQLLSTSTLFHPFATASFPVYNSHVWQGFFFHKHLFFCLWTYWLRWECFTHRMVSFLWVFWV